MRKPEGQAREKMDNLDYGWILQNHSAINLTPVA
jgi:hypothetical protein